MRALVAASMISLVPDQGFLWTERIVGPPLAHCLLSRAVTSTSQAAYQG